MPLAIAQYFPLGRFHATRWNQNPFEDPYGEWPPSSWRLLRALAARWIQYSRETGDENQTLRDELLRALASGLPAFRLPEFSWRGPALRQYQPTGLEDQYNYRRDPKTNKKVLDYSYKQTGKTLVQDHYRLIPPEQPVVWFWNSVALAPEQMTLLRELLRRIVYFGRAESFSQFRVLDDIPVALRPNCTLVAASGQGLPVLVAKPGAELNLDVLLAGTDDQLLARRRIPPGAAWYYAQPPARPVVRPKERAVPRFPANLTVVQFAVGGRVYPPPARCIKITERFRGQVLRVRARQLTGEPKALYENLTEPQREELALLSGKNAQGRRLEGHSHAYFLLWPDENQQPTRLVCFRQTPFTQEEIEALLQAAERPYAWESGSPDWSLRLVPLPFETPPPAGLLAKSAGWVSATPFVPPGNRRRFRKGGRERAGESPERLLTKLLLKCNFPQPVAVSRLDDLQRPDWTYVHATRQERLNLRKQRTPAVRAGFRFIVVFPEPVRGPICLGHSCHFGLGLFMPRDT